MVSSDCVVAVLRRCVDLFECLGWREAATRCAPADCRFFWPRRCVTQCAFQMTRERCDETSLPFLSTLTCFAVHPLPRGSWCLREQHRSQLVRKDASFSAGVFFVLQLGKFGTQYALQMCTDRCDETVGHERVGDESAFVVVERGLVECGFGVCPAPLARVGAGPGGGDAEGFSADAGEFHFVRRGVSGGC